MKKVMRNVCVLVLFYAGVLLACVAGVSILGLAVSIPNAPMTGVAVWFIFCFGGLCVPDEVWNRWLLKK